MKSRIYSVLFLFYYGIEQALAAKLSGKSLPPRLGVLPPSAVVEEENHWETDKKYKKEGSKKCEK